MRHWLPMRLPHHLEGWGQVSVCVYPRPDKDAQPDSKMGDALQLTCAIVVGIEQGKECPDDKDVCVFGKHHFGGSRAAGQTAVGKTESGLGVGLGKGQCSRSECTVAE